MIHIVTFMVDGKCGGCNNKQMVVVSLLFHSHNNLFFDLLYTSAFIFFASYFSLLCFSLDVVELAKIDPYWSTLIGFN